MLYQYAQRNIWFEKKHITATANRCESVASRRSRQISSTCSVLLLTGVGVLTSLVCSGCVKPRVEFLPEHAATQSYYLEMLNKKIDVERIKDLNVFSPAPSIIMKLPERVILYRKAWKNPQDLSGKAWLLHTERAIYFAAQIKDDEVKYAGHPGEWNGDAVNLFLKTETEEGVREFIFKFTCAGTRYCYYDRQSYNGEEYQWGVSRAERVADGYWIAAEIPKRNLGLLGLSDEKLWFNISIEDNDKGGYMILLGKSEGFLNEPSWIPAILK